MRDPIDQAHIAERGPVAHLRPRYGSRSFVVLKTEAPAFPSLLEREIQIVKMRTKIWYAPDRSRYTLTILDEPFDAHRTLAFQCHDDGWIGAVTIGRSIYLWDLKTDELTELLEHAKATN